MSKPLPHMKIALLLSDFMLIQNTSSHISPLLDLSLSLGIHGTWLSFNLCSELEKYAVNTKDS
jgi:hypothetical protein